MELTGWAGAGVGPQTSPWTQDWNSIKSVTRFAGSARKCSSRNLSDTREPVSDAHPPAGKSSYNPSEARTGMWASVGETNELIAELYIMTASTTIRRRWLLRVVCLLRKLLPRDIAAPRAISSAPNDNRMCVAMATAYNAVGDWYDNLTVKRTRFRIALPSDAWVIWRRLASALCMIPRRDEICLSLWQNR